MIRTGLWPELGELDPELAGELTLGVHAALEDARRSSGSSVLCLDDDGARTVAEEDRHVAALAW